jgi:hypothetical protein
MTIAQALKEKNKKTSKIQKLWIRIAQFNSVEEGEERPYDLQKTWDDYLNEIGALVELKSKIHAASSPVRVDIFDLSELKGIVKNIHSLDVTNGKKRERYSESAVEVSAHFNVSWKDLTIEKLEEKIDLLQEKLNLFNHTTNI